MGYTRLSPRFWIARQTEIGILGALLLGICALVAPFNLGAAALMTAPALVATLIIWVVERGRYRAWGYTERDADLVVERGLLFKRISVVPYGRMQFIDVSAGPIDRLFGLATVQLHTAAAASDARIPGLRRDDANVLRDRLTAIGEAQATGL